MSATRVSFDAFNPCIPYQGEAQEICWDAFDTPDPATKRALAQEALDVDPLCIDACNIFAGLANNEQDYAKVLEWAQKASDSAYRLNPDIIMIKPCEWGINEHRPYLRSLFWKVIAFNGLQMWQEALHAAKFLLEVNPGDNQGVRYMISDLLFRTGNYEGQRALLAQFPDEASIKLVMAGALLAFLDSKSGTVGDIAVRDKKLKNALKENPLVADYLLGKKVISEKSPEYITVGGASEAQEYARHSQAIWETIPGALDWLRSVANKK